MHNESWSAFKVQSGFFKQTNPSPPPTSSTAGDKFHHHASYDEFSGFKQLQTVTIMTHDYHGPPSTLRRRPIHLGLFLG